MQSFFKNFCKSKCKTITKSRFIGLHETEIGVEYPREYPKKYSLLEIPTDLMMLGAENGYIIMYVQNLD